jgi:hypothetical protein
MPSLALGYYPDRMRPRILAATLNGINGRDREGINPTSRAQN